MSTHGFVTETATYKVQRGITKKIHIQELWLLCSAGRLIVLNICMKFYEHILDGFKVIEWKLLLTKFKGTELKSINKRVMVLALCMSSNVG